MLSLIWIKYVPYVYYSGVIVMFLLTIKLLSSKQSKISVGMIIAFLFMILTSWIGLLVSAILYKKSLGEKKGKDK